MFHIHKWKITNTDYTEPFELPEGRYSYSFLLDKALSGTTHIYFVCERCGDVKQKDVLGKFSLPPLTEQTNEN